MITADQLVLHAVGDYLLQSDWMAGKKTLSWKPAAVHALTYTVPFALLTRSPWVLLVICVTHYFIDRYRLARYVVFAKNWVGSVPGKRPTWIRCSATGYDCDSPSWLSVWLLIIADNVIHIILNGLAIKYL